MGPQKYTPAGSRIFVPGWPSRSLPPGKVRAAARRPFLFVPAPTVVLLLSLFVTLDSSPTIRPEIEAWLADFQQRLCQQLETADAGPAHFLTDTWQREGGGGGRSRVLEHGRILEKGGVGFSAVWGAMSEAAARQLHMPDPHFYATGVSVVLTRAAPAYPSSI